MAQEEQNQVSSNPKTTTQLTIGSQQQQKDSEVNLSIRFLSEELLQISELSEMERGYAGELAAYLKQFLEPMGMPFHIKPSSLLRSDSSLSDVILTPQGTLILMHNNGMVNSKSLDSLQSETLLRILNELIPEMKSVLSERRQKISGRVGMLEKATREFRRVPPGTSATTVIRKSHSSSQGGYSGGKEKESSSQGGESEDALKAALTKN